MDIINKYNIIFLLLLVFFGTGFFQKDVLGATPSDTELITMVDNLPENKTSYLMYWGRQVRYNYGYGYGAPDYFLIASEYAPRSYPWGECDSHDDGYWINSTGGLQDCDNDYYRAVGLGAYSARWNDLYKWDSIIEEWILEPQPTYEVGYEMLQTDYFSWSSDDVYFSGDNDPITNTNYPAIESGDVAIEGIGLSTETENIINSVGSTSYNIRHLNGSSYLGTYSNGILNTILNSSDTYKNSFFVYVPTSVESFTTFKITICDSSDTVCIVDYSVLVSDMNLVIEGVYSYDHQYDTELDDKNIYYELTTPINFIDTQMSLYTFLYIIDDVNAVITGSDSQVTGSDFEDYGKWGNLILSIGKTLLLWAFIPSQDYRVYYYDQFVTTMDLKLPYITDAYNSINSGKNILSTATQSRPTLPLGSVMGTNVDISPMFDMLEVPLYNSYSMISLIRLFTGGSLLFFFALHVHSVVRDKIFI